MDFVKKKSFVQKICWFRKNSGRGISPAWFVHLRKIDVTAYASKYMVNS